MVGEVLKAEPRAAPYDTTVAAGSGHRERILIGNAPRRLLGWHADSGTSERLRRPIPSISGETAVERWIDTESPRGATTETIRLMTFLSLRELDDDDLELVALATSTIDSTTDADSADADGVHTVGAAVMAGDYRKFAGVNLYHFTGGPCAELVALGAARAHGACEIVTIVAVGNHGRGVLAPCGRDRQVLADYHPSCRAIIPTPEGPRSVLVTELLPGAYQWPDAVPRPDERIELLFSARYLDAVRSGAKTRTTRVAREAASGPVRLVFPTDPRTRLDAIVTSVRKTTLGDLTIDDAHAEQCQNPDDLRRFLAQHYPDIAADAEVWVHEFSLEP